MNAQRFPRFKNLDKILDCGGWVPVAVGLAGNLKKSVKYGKHTSPEMWV